MNRAERKHRAEEEARAEKAALEAEALAHIDRQAFIAADPACIKACGALAAARNALKAAEHAEWRARENLTAVRADAEGRWWATHKGGPADA
jgi:hypothetical protein